MIKCFNFLGITIDEYLNWKTQIDIVCKKVSQTIGILKILQLYFPIHILKNMYYSLILSHLNYGILAWGYKSEKVVKLQKKAIRTVTNSKNNSHTEPLFKEISCLKFDNLLDLNLLKFYYCYSNQLLPSYFDSFNFIKRSSVHSYNTRNRNLLLH